MKRGARGSSDAGHIYAILLRFNPSGGRSLALIGALSFGSGLTEAAILAVITGVAVDASGKSSDHVFAGHTFTNNELLGIALLLLIINTAVAFVVSWLTSGTAARSSQAARSQLLEAFHRASYERKSGGRVAALQEALTTYVDRFSVAFNGLIVLVSAALSLTSFAVMAIIINASAAIALMLIGALIVGVQRPIVRRTKASSRALARGRARYAEGATESVLMAREFAVFGVADEASDHLMDLDHSVVAHFRRTKFLASISPRIYQSLALLLTIGALAFITRSKIADLAAVATVALILLRSLSYGQQIISGLQTLAESRTYLDRLTDLIDSYRAEPRTQGHVSTGPTEHIRFEGVGFSYEEGTSVVKGLDLSIQAGETVGIVGPSGAGKTTLVNLLLRLYEPDEGQILINDVELAQVDDAEWHARTAIVPQEPRLLHGTIADNITFMRDIAPDAVERAAEQAGIANFIRSLPLQFEAPVGELGAGLSGGQRQRICIARALAGGPDLLVLDEPTSALDGESEAGVQRTLRDLRGSVTMVIVAHRLSTLSICDRIFVVDGGRIAAVGTQEDLRRDSAYFREALEHAGL